MQAVKGRRRRYIDATVPDSHLDRRGKTAQLKTALQAQHASAQRPVIRDLCCNQCKGM